MEKELSKELASKLKREIAANEDWLIKRILYYAKQQGYTAYTSALEEAWRASIAGLSKPILDTPSTSFYVLGLHPHSDFQGDEYAQFGISEAQKHRERGISLTMFIGLFKYYRQSYEDLLFKLEMSPEDVRNCRSFLKRYFDKVELGFLDEWTKTSGSEINSEMAEANRRLTNEKSLYLTTIESLKQPVVVTDANGNPKIMNSAAAELFSEKKTVDDLHYGRQMPDMTPSVSKKARDFLEDHQPVISYIHVIDNRVFDITFTRMKDVSGKFIGLAIILNDITDKIQTETTLEDSESMRKAFMEGIDAAALVLDMEVGLVTDFNSKVEELFEKDAYTKGFTEECPLFYEELGGKSDSVFELAEKGVSNEERLISLCEGGVKPVRLFSIEVWFKNRRHKILIIFDITREKMLERRANHIQQLEVLGDIAGSLPFMLKESTGYLQITISKLSEEAAEIGFDSSLLAELDKAVDCTNHISEVLGALASIVQYDCETACIDMNQLVHNCVILTIDKWHPYGEIDLNLSSGMKGIICCPDEMGQVFLNLLVNASYAVRKKFEADGERGLINIASRYTGDFYEVRIADTGIGIKKQDLKRIFDKGFTTREVGRVTGNGLAIVYDLVVRRYKGTIEFKSAEGKGTEFIIRLPIS